MSHDAVINDDRNFATASDVWDSGIDFSQYTNTYKLLAALLSQADTIDDSLNEIYHSHKIETASGEELDQFGSLVDLPRQSNEPDEKYRSRIKAEFAQAITQTNFNSFAEFTSTVLGTDIQNIDIETNYEINSAAVDVYADQQIYDEKSLTEQDISDILGGGVPAGHEVRAFKKGTFITIDDNGTNNPNNGLTSDSIETGGTLAADLVE